MPPPSYFADRIIKSLGIKDPTDLALLDAIAFERGAVVRYQPIEGAEARITIVGRRAIITVSTTISDSRRRRFSVAHELGHFEMHRQLGPLTICTPTDLDSWLERQAGQQRELEASAFAAALLMPETFVRLVIGNSDPGLGVVRNIAETFSVSLTAAGRRFVEFSSEPCAVVYSQRGIIRWFQGSPEFYELGHFVDVQAKVDPNTAAGAYFQGLALPARPRRVPAQAWLRQDRGHRQTTLIEDSMALPSYRAVLTLLWADESSSDDDWLEYEPDTTDED